MQSLRRRTATDLCIGSDSSTDGLADGVEHRLRLLQSVLQQQVVAELELVLVLPVADASVAEREVSEERLVLLPELLIGYDDRRVLGRAVALHALFQLMCARCDERSVLEVVEAVVPLVFTVGVQQRTGKGRSHSAYQRIDTRQPVAHHVHILVVRAVREQQRVERQSLSGERHTLPPKVDALSPSPRYQRQVQLLPVGGRLLEVVEHLLISAGRGEIAP